ncbi:fatty acid desaturase family protein [Caulobacter sp. KR2-114]|uniref:fatty acid desaturase family protein n=1 Tax=Caulobacter sp. KR2-114 TaxID=3400912 RepID=UPI003C0AF140
MADTGGEATGGDGTGDGGAGPLLDRETYRRLSTRRDGLAALLLAIRVAFHVALLTTADLLFVHGQVLAAIALLIPHVMAWSFLGWAGIGHELYHRSVFSSRRLNLALFRLFSILTWSNYGYFEVTHPAHHRNTLGDGDLEANPHARLTILGTLALLTVDVGTLWRRLQILALNAAGAEPRGALARLFPPGSAEFIQLRDGARAVLAGQALLIGVCLAFGSPFLALAISLAPFCLTFPTKTLSALQHFGLTAGETPGDYAASTRTVVLDPVTSFFYADMNYHLEHHHFPAIPHYHLRALHGLFRDAGRHRHLEVGYWNGVKLLAREGFFTGGR